MDKKAIADAIKVGANIILSEEGRKFLCGTYSDGTPRSLQDSVRDELYSPSTKEKKIKKAKKSKKKRKGKGFQL